MPKQLNMAAVQCFGFTTIKCVVLFIIYCLVTVATVGALCWRWMGQSSYVSLNFQTIQTIRPEVAVLHEFSDSEVAQASNSWQTALLDASACMLTAAFQAFNTRASALCDDTSVSWAQPFMATSTMHTCTIISFLMGHTCPVRAVLKEHSLKRIFT